MKEKIILSNNKLHLSYELDKFWIAGLKLTGIEVKEIRNKRLSLQNSFITIKKHEVYLQNIKFAHLQINKIKLLLNKHEIYRMKKIIYIKGYSILCLSIFSNENNILKTKLVSGKGLKKYDKRAIL